MKAGASTTQASPKWRWLLFLAALEAGAAFAVLSALPREGQGISPARAALLGFLLACVLAEVWLAYRLPAALSRLERPSFIFAIFAISILAAAGLFLLRYLDPPVLLPYYSRSAPVLFYVLAMGLESCAFLLVVRFGPQPAALASRVPAPIAEFLALGALTTVFLLVSLTRIGLKPDPAYWGEPGVPLLGWQLAVIVIAGLLLALARMRWRQKSPPEILIALAIWLFAVGVWLSVPASVTRNSFYAPITAPNNQPYPNSDASYYDSMAESLLIGQPYQGAVPTRPLYIALLAGLHSLLGENYGLIIAGQTAVLALIPVVLYFLGLALHGRVAGVMAASAAIFREWTTVLVSSQTRVSDSRTLLVDLPTLLLLLLACLLSVRWARSRDARSALLTGGTFGLLLLLRTQSLLIAPLLILVAVVATGLRSRLWRLPVALFITALVAACLPWLVHNYLATGKLAFDAPFQYQIIASQYQYAGNLDINNVDLQGRSVAGILMAFLLRDPGFVLGFIATHFLATQIDGLLVLPLFHNFAGLNAPINPYWLAWDGHPGWLNGAVMVLYLAVIAIGLGAAWRRLAWAGLVPLLFSLGYSLANGVGRFSGWRYDLPADWIAYFYFFIGIAQIISIAAAWLGSTADRLPRPAEVTSSAPLSALTAVVPIAVFALIGALPWLAETIASPRYAQADPARLLSELAASPAVLQSGLRPDALQSFVAAPSSFVQSGRLLYPRFFSRGLGLASAHPLPAYAPRDFPRLGFLLLNQNLHDVVLPTRSIAGTIPQASDVIVVGCQHGDYVEAMLVFLPASQAVFVNPSPAPVCE